MGRIGAVLALYTIGEIGSRYGLSTGLAVTGAVYVIGAFSLLLLPETFGAQPGKRAAWLRAKSRRAEVRRAEWKKSGCVHTLNRGTVMNGRDYLDRKTLILGDVNSGENDPLPGNPEDFAGAGWRGGSSSSICAADP